MSLSDRLKKLFWLHIANSCDCKYLFFILLKLWLFPTVSTLSVTICHAHKKTSETFPPESACLNQLTQNQNYLNCIAMVHFNVNVIRRVAYSCSNEAHSIPHTAQLEAFILCSKKSIHLDMYERHAHYRYNEINWGVHTV